MFYCTVDFQIMEDSCANVLITSDTRDGCIERMAEFVRDCLSGGSDGEWWYGASGIISCLFLAKQQGHTVYNVGAGGARFPDDYFQENEQVGCINRLWYDRADDFFDVHVYDGEEGYCVISEHEVDEGGDYYNEETECPDFEACAVAIERMVSAPA